MTEICIEFIVFPTLHTLPQGHSLNLFTISILRDESSMTVQK